MPIETPTFNIIVLKESPLLIPCNAALNPHSATLAPHIPNLNAADVVELATPLIAP